MHSVKTIIIWFITATPFISAVPTLPIMILSSIFTKFVIPFWISIGTISFSSRL